MQEIGTPDPQPTDKKWKRQRLEADESLQRHLEICYPEAFPLKWSPDHLRLIKDIERAADVGLLKCLAMPRGSGKTSIVMRAGLWTLLTRRRNWCSIISATELAARNLLKGIKTEIQYNANLAMYYPRELFAMRALQNEPMRARGQKSQGVTTGVEWLADRISFGAIEGVDTSGAILSSTGITGSIRGQQTVQADGTIQRPDIALIDDPQSSESAASEKQCQDRHSIMMGDVLGLAGPGQTLSAITTCTIIHQDDLASRLLDRELSSEWQGETCRMVYKWPKAEELWEEYASIRNQELIDGGTGERATKFYKKNRKKMDEGSEVAWPERHTDKELSAIQHAYNLKLRDEAAFMAEYQNDPLNIRDQIPFDIKPNEVSRRVVNVERGTLPAEASKVTAFVDVQKELLFYCVVAWSNTGRGCVIEYGTYPDQKRIHFTKADVRFKLQDLPGVASLDEAIYRGLTELSENLLSRQFRRADGVEMPIDRLAVDAAWGFSTATVRRFCSETSYRGRIYPSFGQYLGANSQPWHKLATDRRDMAGLHCRLESPEKRRWAIRELKIDTNWWKSFAAERLLCPAGSNRAIVLYKAPPHHHQMFAEHCAAEDPTLTISKYGSQCIEWKANPGKHNNDYWDCLVGCCVLASLEGVRVQTSDEKSTKKRVSSHPRTLGKAKTLGKAH